MEQYFLLNSRRRAVIALIHSVFFLTVAAFGVFGAARTPLSTHSVRGVVLYGIYGIVTTLLLWLLAKALCLRERLYFGLCAGSAGLSIVRGLLGESALHPFQWLKIVLLLSAGVVAVSIHRVHDPAAPRPDDAPEAELAEAD